MPIRALVVDDSGEYRDLLVDALTKAKCEVETAKSLDEAQTWIRRQLFHVATIDIRLSQTDITNQDGAILVKWLSQPHWDSQIARFVISQTPEVKQLIESVTSLNPFEIDDAQYAGGVSANNTLYFHKERLDIEKFKDHVTKAVHNRNFELSFGNQKQIEQITRRIQREVQRRIAKADAEERQTYGWFLDLTEEDQITRVRQEVEDLLRQIFPSREVGSLELRPIGQGLSGSSVIQAVPASRGNVNIIQYPVLIKLGYWRQIDWEMENYHRYVRGHVKQRPALQATGRTVLLSAIIYDWLDDFTSFGEYYRDTSKKAQDLVDLVEQLFTHTCEKWYRETRVDMIHYHEVYPAYLHCAPEVVTAALPDLHVQLVDNNRLIHFMELPRNLPNPAYVLEEQKRTNSGFSYQTRLGITHGDYNENNILIKTQMPPDAEEPCFVEPWIIDFYRAQVTDSLRDFAQLEATVKFNLLPDDVSLAQCYILEEMLVKQKVFCAKEQLLSSFDLLPPPLQRTLCVVAAIRGCAYTLLFRGVDARPAVPFDRYLAALFYCSVNAARHVQRGDQAAEGLAVHRARYALLASAMIAEQLAEGA